MKVISKSVLRGLLLGLAGLVAAAGTVWAWRELMSERGAVHIQEERLAHVPETRARQAATAAEVKKRALDIHRIEAFIGQTEALGSLVEEFEAAGRARGATLTVPGVEEKQLVDESGNVVPASGPMLEVRLKLVGVGAPKNLLALLHDIEYAQHLTYFESWRLDASPETARNQAATLAGETVSARNLAVLTADLIVAVRRPLGGNL